MAALTCFESSVCKAPASGAGGTVSDAYESCTTPHQLKQPSTAQHSTAQYSTARAVLHMHCSILDLTQPGQLAPHLQGKCHPTPVVRLGSQPQRAQVGLEAAALAVEEAGQKVRVQQEPFCVGLQAGCVR